MTHARRIKYLPLSEVGRAPRNPNGHDLPALRSSIRRHGFVEPVIVDERTGFLLGGHGRLDTLVEMEASGEAPPPGVHSTKAGWTVPVVLGYSSENDAEAEALLLAMIALPRAGDVHQQLLTEMLSDLAASDRGLDGTGYTNDDLTDLLSGAAGDLDDLGGDDELGELGDPAERGRLLNVLDVAFGEPTHKVNAGEVWKLGHHTLAVMHLLREHPSWKPLLQDHMLFVPYPSPYLLLSRRADKTPCLAIQPNLYLAGHVLDKYTSVHGPDSVELLT